MCIRDRRTADQDAHADEHRPSEGDRHHPPDQHDPPGRREPDRHDHQFEHDPPGQRGPDNPDDDHEHDDHDREHEHEHDQESAQSGHEECGPDPLVTPQQADRIAQIITARPAVHLQVVVPWDVLAGTPACGPHQSTAEILGRHPAFLTPGHARELGLTPGTTLSRLLIDPADGRLIERSIASYRPDAAMRRQIIAADVTSRSPGSRTPATSCEIDLSLIHI